jgi:hypothetical protein
MQSGLPLPLLWIVKDPMLTLEELHDGVMT